MLFEFFFVQWQVCLTSNLFTWYVTICWIQGRRGEGVVEVVNLYLEVISLTMKLLKFLLADQLTQRVMWGVVITLHPLAA